MAYLKSRINAKSRDQLEPSRTFNEVLRSSSSKESLMKYTYGDLKVKNHDSHELIDRPTTTIG